MHRIALVLGFFAALFSGIASAQWQTSSLPYPQGTRYFYVSKTAGNNANDGSVNRPWKDLSFAYEEMFRSIVNTTGDQFAPAALIVEPGYYAPSNGEQFPIEMKAFKFIGGMDAHTTIVSLEQSGSSIFRFIGRQTQSGVPDARLGPFYRTDGPYLERLTLRNSLAMDASNITPVGTSRGIEMNGQTWDPSIGFFVNNCKIVQPTLAQLVVYGFGFGILADPAEPRIVDCTIVNNTTGLRVSGIFGCVPPCTKLEVVNSVVNGNTVDLFNVDQAGVSFTNFTVATAGGACSGMGVTPPTLGGPAQNPAIPFGSLKFVNAQPPAFIPTVLEQEFDFRLDVDSPLRHIGRWSWAPDPLTPLWDGEGFANLRMGTTTTVRSDIGADQFNSFRLEPLFRVFDHNITIQSVAVGWPNQPGNTTGVELDVTPVSVSSPTVLAYPLYQDPSLSTSYLPLPLFDPNSFDGILAIDYTILAPIPVANTTPPTSTTLYFPVPAGFPLIMQVAFVETLPSGATRISLSNGQRLPAMP
jgi:hypothetical protein